MPPRKAAAVLERPDVPDLPQIARALAPEHSTPLRLPPGLEDGEMVVAVNEGIHPLTITWNSKNFVLEPGKPKRVPFEAATLWFGDPRTGPTAGMVKHESGAVTYLASRSDEVRRLRTKYGNVFGDESAFNDIPLIRLETMEGEEIPTVLEYPDGLPTLELPGSTDLDALKIQLIRQQNTIEQLKAALGLDKSDLPSAPADDEREVLATDTDE